MRRAASLPRRSAADHTAWCCSTRWRRRTRRSSTSCCRCSTTDGSPTARAAFKPEFLNRLDDVIVFDALSTSELTQIVDLQVDRLAARLAGRRLTLTVTPAAREWLALTGFDPVYGARPLRRLVQSAVGDQLAKALLGGDILDGDEVKVDRDEARDALRVTRGER